MLHSAESSRYVNNYIITHDSSLRVGTQEATTKIITVQDFDIATVKCLVSFFYTGDYYGEPPEESAQDEDTVVTDADADEQAGGDSATPSDNEEDTKEINDQTLLFHLKVNAIADYYDIPELRDLAKSKVGEILHAHETILPCLLREVSSGAHANLNSIIAKAVTEVHDFSKLLKQNDTCVKLDPILYTEIIAACSKEMAILNRKLKVFQERYKTQLACTMANDKAIDTCLGKLNETQKCRHCDEKFSCFIEAEAVTFGSSQRTYMLRCKSCRTRHP